MLDTPWRQLGWMFDTFSVGYDSTSSDINFLMTNAFSIISHVLESERESPKSDDLLRFVAPPSLRRLSPSHMLSRIKHIKNICETKTSPPSIEKATETAAFIHHKFMAKGTNPRFINETIFDSFTRL